MASDCGTVLEYTEYTATLEYTATAVLALAGIAGTAPVSTGTRFDFEFVEVVC